jgi:iron-sulfur cluster assembly protein
MSIQLTSNAAAHVKVMLEKRGHGVGLRLGTKKAGCTGFEYVIDYADEVHENDEVFESHDIKVIVDKASLPNIAGSEVDYVKTNAINHGFEFRNPNVQDMCGCGESFSVASNDETDSKKAS